jgi:hypothetical protein
MGCGARSTLAGEASLRRCDAVRLGPLVDVVTPGASAELEDAISTDAGAIVAFDLAGFDGGGSGAALSLMLGAFAPDGSRYGAPSPVFSFPITRWTRASLASRPSGYGVAQWADGAGCRYLAIDDVGRPRVTVGGALGQVATLDARPCAALAADGDGWSVQRSSDGGASFDQRLPFEDDGRIGAAATPLVDDASVARAALADGTFLVLRNQATDARCPPCDARWFSAREDASRATLSPPQYLATSADFGRPTGALIASARATITAGVASGWASWSGEHDGAVTVTPVTFDGARRGASSTTSTGEPSAVTLATSRLPNGELLLAWIGADAGRLTLSRFDANGVRVEGPIVFSIGAQAATTRVAIVATPTEAGALLFVQQDQALRVAAATCAD